MNPTNTSQATGVFTPYHKLVLALLAFLQFTIILDFMILSPLGALLMPALAITPAQFGLVVSAYAFSAGISGFLAAGFADRFDRKTLLLFFYAGFLVGTLLCGMATNYPFLLGARIVTGIFGGVMGSIIFAIVTDLFAYEVRGRVMGIVQTAFAASQVLGIPASLFVSNLWNWHAPFLLIVGVGLTVFFVIVARLKPIDAHLRLKVDRHPLHHLLSTVLKGDYAQAFATTALLSTGGFMLMPFASKFTVNNLGIDLARLPLIYLVTGCCALIVGPLVGRASDAFGNFKVFTIGSVITIAMVLIYTNLGVTPLGTVILINVVLFTGIFSRMIPSQAMMSVIPAPQDRGAFMAVGAATQQLSGGIASLVAGLLVAEGADGSLLHFNRLGYTVVGAVIVTWTMMLFIQRKIQVAPSSPLEKAA